MDWQPIETAPKDGTQVLVWSRYQYPNSSTVYEGCSVAAWDGDWNVYGEGMAASTAKEEAFTVEPSFWMPLPMPPVANG